MMSFVKKEETQTKTDAAALDDMIKGLASQNGESSVPNSVKIYNALSLYYNEFWEILANKRLSAAAPTPKPSPSSSSPGSTLKI